MDVKTGFFYLFSVVLLFAACRVVTARNPVHAVLFLMLSFSQASALWLLLKAEFLAIVLVLVYLGAVMVLFLFVVMMLDVSVDRVREGFWKNFPLAATLGGLVAIEMAVVLMGGFRLTDERAMTSSVAGVPYSNTFELGKLLYTQYLYPVEVAAVLLLVAIIAAIALTLRERKGSKHIDPSEQIRVRAADRVRLVKMGVTQQAPDPVGLPMDTAAATEKKA